MTRICQHCGGTGDENAFGPRIGACRICRGSGHSEWIPAPPPRKSYICTINPQEEADRIALLDYYEAHAHHID